MKLISIAWMPITRSGIALRDCLQWIMRIYQRNGSPNWWASWTDQKGRRHRKSIGTDDKNLAQALVAKWQQDDFVEHHFGSIPVYPFQEAVLRYGHENRRQNANRYVISYKYRLEGFLDRFGEFNVANITPAMIQDYAD